MKNLRIETAEILQENGKSAADVRWVKFGTPGAMFHCTFDEFVAAANFEYDDGFGGNEIGLSVKVVGDDWWLERGEYDGSEWWEFKTLPTKPEMHRVPLADDLQKDY